MNEVLKLSDADYFAASGLSNSYLINFDKSPLLAETGIENTKSMQDGSAVHNYILNSQLISGYSEEKLKVLSEKILNYKLDEDLLFSDILNNSQKEISLFWEEIINGELVQRKAKIDIMQELSEKIIIIDLKKTRDIYDFAYSIRKYKYYRQAATYTDGAIALFKKPVIFIFLAFEFEYPYNVKAFSISENDIDRGRVANLKSIMNYQEWSKNPSLEISGIENLSIF